MRSTSLRVLLPAASLLVGQAACAETSAAVAIDATLSLPSDSHEPQSAAIDLRTTGPDPIEASTVRCSFLGDDGATLETRDAQVARIDGRATVRAAVIYYGWPRAARVVCRRVPPAG